MRSEFTQNRSRRVAVFIFSLAMLFAMTFTGFSQTRGRKISGGGNGSGVKAPVSKGRGKVSTVKRKGGDDNTKGRSIVSEGGLQRVTDEITQTQLFAPKSSR